MNNPDIKNANASVIPANADPATLRKMLEEALAEKAEWAAKEAKRQEELAFKTKIDAEPRFNPTRNILIVRRVTNPEEIAPAVAVFDHIEVQDLKAMAKPNLKRITVSERELAAYQTIKSEGVKGITYEMLEARLKKAGPKDASKDESTEAEEDASAE